MIRHALVAAALVACATAAWARAPERGAPKKGQPRKPQAAARAEVEARQGFGSQTRGGGDGRVVDVEEATEAAVRLAFQKANKTGDVTIRFPAQAVIAIGHMLPRLTAPNVTLDGNGATLDGATLDRDVALVDVRSHDVVVRDLRLRNGYDNLRIQGDDAHDVFVTHVSSTGSRDDGISIGYGAHDVTVEWSFLAGNTRSIFCKYGATTDLSLHHLWIQKSWIRSPLISGHIRADVRNVLVEDWGEWGARFEDGATGNVVASLFVLSPYAAKVGAKRDSALRFVDAGPVFTDKNVFRGEAKPPTTEPVRATAPIAAAPVLTHDVDSMEEIVRARAGCLPRDTIDRAYIALREGWHVGENEPLRAPGAGSSGAPTLRTAPTATPAVSPAPR